MAVLKSGMKICYWTNYPSRYQAVFFHALREAGVDLRVVYFTTYDQYRMRLGWRDDRVLEPWEIRASSVSAVRKASPDFDERIQVCTGFYGCSYWRLVIYCVAKRVAWCACTEGSRGGFLTWPLRVFFARLVDRFSLGVFAIGSEACRQYAGWGVRDAKIAWHCHSTPVPVSSQRPPRGERCTFVFCGALIRRKGVDVLLEAFAKVHAVCDGVSLRLIGDGSMRGWCEEFAQKHLKGEEGAKGAGSITLVGAVTPECVEDELRQGDVVVLPSRYDAWGMTLAEGAALGLAMIGSDRTGAALDLIEEGENGFCVPAGDVDALAAAMLRYARCPAMAAEHGVKAQAAVGRTFAEVRAQAFVRQLRAWTEER